MINIQRILIFIAAAIAIFYLASEVGEGSFGMAVMVIGGGAGIAGFLALDRNIWLVIPVSLINPISLAFLPVPFKSTEIAFLVVVFYLVFAHAALKHRGFALGPANIWLPVVILMLIIFYHQREGGFGLRSLGGENAGARRHALFLIGFVFYVTMLSVWPKAWKWVGRLPGLYAIVVLASAIPNLFCIYFPGPAFAMGIFWIFAGLGDVMNYYMADLQRVGLWGGIGTMLQFWLVSRYPMRTWFTAPRITGLLVGLLVGGLLVFVYRAFGGAQESDATRMVLAAFALSAALVACVFWRERLVLFLSVMALLFCAYSGFRGSVVQYLMITAVAAVLSLRWKLVAFALPLGAVVAFLVLGNNTLFQLPESIQRSLCFIPGGRWDPDVLSNADASLDFRRLIRDLYLERYAMNSPWLGNGYKMATRDVGMVGDRPLGLEVDQFEGFILSKDFHTGWISMYDSVGVIGSAAFIWLCAYLLLYLYRRTRQVGWNRLAPVQIWVTCYVVTNIAGFFLLFGDLSSMMPTLLFGAGLAVVVFEQWPLAQAEQQKLQQADSAADSAAGRRLRGEIKPALASS